MALKRTHVDVVEVSTIELHVVRLAFQGFDHIPAEIDVKEIVPKMQSLPQSVKDEFQRRLAVLYKDDMTPVDDNVHLSIKYSNQMAIVDTNNNINGWAPSSSDSLATDWMVLD